MDLLLVLLQRDENNEMMKAGVDNPPVPCNEDDDDVDVDDDDDFLHHYNVDDDEELTYSVGIVDNDDDDDDENEIDEMIGPPRTLGTKQQQQQQQHDRSPPSPRHPPTQQRRYNGSSSFSILAATTTTATFVDEEQQPQPPQVAAYDYDCYERARTWRAVRHGEYWTHPRTGILSLYCHVTEIKQDLDFAQCRHCVVGSAVAVGGGGGGSAARTSTSNITRDDEHYLAVDYAEFVQQSRTNRLWRWPIVTVALVTVLVAVFLYEVGYNGWSVEHFPENPFLGPSTETLVALGAIYTPDIVTKDNNGDNRYPSFYRFLAATFLHSGLLHLLVHLPLIYILGRALERAGGQYHHHQQEHHSPHFYHRVVVLLVFCGAGFCANVTTATIGEPFATHAGPAGALCGWYGYCLVDGLLHLHLVTNYRHTTILFGIVVELIIWFLVGLLPFMDNTAHVFGFGSGALLGLILIPARSLRQAPMDCFWQGNRAGLAAAILFCSVSSSLLYLYNAESVVDLPCRQCHRFLSCVLWPDYYCDPCQVATTTPDRTPGGYYLLHCPYEETVRSREPFDDIVATCRENCDLY